MKTVLVTGADGFIGKNLTVSLQLTDSVQVDRFTRQNSMDELEKMVERADFIYHLAGVNRPTEESEFSKDNTDLTQTIADILKKHKLKTPIVLSSSTQAELQNPYGESKKAAEDIMFDLQAINGNSVFVYRLPGVFGKWCRPNYNSVVATFCHNLANNLDIVVDDPSKSIALAYVDDVVDTFISHLNAPEQQIDTNGLQQIPRLFDVTLGDLVTRLKDIRDIRTKLLIPDLKDLLNKFLYATYISYLPTTEFSYDLTKNTDDRGWLAEFVKSESSGQMFISKTKPGITRGEHWHHTKIEKFLVVSGEGEITFRSELEKDGQVYRYKVNGDDVTVLDIPTGYVHAIKNVGESDLVTVFWANEILDKNRPDTYYEKVEE